jgi:phosphoserine aminotransferase
MHTQRVYNFSAGPATLPDVILQTAREELLNWQNTGCSVMEIGHRTPEFTELLNRAESSLRSLLTIPDDYHVLFLGTPARSQFSMLPLNVLSSTDSGAYLISGLWSKMAFEEAHRLKRAYSLADSAPYLCTPKFQPSMLQADTAYLYYTPNETVHGVRYSTVPESGAIPLVADMTSCLLTEPIRISDYGLIFAGAQKNIAPAGLTLVIIRGAFLKQVCPPQLPTCMDYRIHVQHASLYATPPTFQCYMADKMFDWIKAQGGVEALYQQNCQKAAKLYQAIDESSFYHAAVDPTSRSIVNVCFTLRRPDYQHEFLAEATKAGLYGLQGHRVVGGLRASLYNAMPMAGVDALIEFMETFATRF